MLELKETLFCLIKDQRQIIAHFCVSVINVFIFLYISIKTGTVLSERRIKNLYKQKTEIQGALDEKIQNFSQDEKDFFNKVSTELAKLCEHRKMQIISFHKKVNSELMEKTKHALDKHKIVINELIKTSKSIRV